VAGRRYSRLPMSSEVKSKAKSKANGARAGKSRRAALNSLTKAKGP
jgi:hypothetical protein